MAEKLFSDYLSGQVCFNSLQEWLAGKESQVISGSLSRTDFVLIVLKYIQEETNKYSALVSSSTQSTPKTHAPQEKSPTHISKNVSKVLEDESKNQRAPFQVLNKNVSTRISTQQFSKQPNNEFEYRRDVHQGLLVLGPGNILTSTPVNYNRRNNSRNNHLPISPPNSFHSDQSSYFSHSSLSSKGSRFSPGSHNFSPNSPQSPFHPSSPQYSDSFPDLNAKTRHRTPQSPCLGDFIKTKPASQKSRKRIKPTQLSTPEKDAPVVSECKKGNLTSFGTVTRPFVLISSPQTEINEQSNFDEERQLLKEKRVQILKSCRVDPTAVSSSSFSNLGDVTEEEQHLTKSNHSVCLNISAEKSTNNASSSQSVKYVNVDPDPNLVTNIEKISRLASIYSACLNANLVPNVTLELYSIFTLLTAGYKSTKVADSTTSSKGSSASDNNESCSSSEHCNNLLEKLSLTESSLHNKATSSPNKGKQKSETKNVFSSIHDCVMFSACVLEKQIDTIQCLDKGILRLLIENARLSLFCPQLIPRLIEAAEKKEAKETSFVSPKENFSFENRPVLYHTETDSQDNFSSKENFNCFKKQRDGFYETLHEWRTKNSDNIWISKRFPQRVQTLLSLSNDPVNMMHLARLFCAQMTSSKGESHEDLELAGVSKDKLSRLEARFSKPTEGGGSPRPPPAFPAEQLFYQQFLNLAVGSTFLQHVTDCLVYRLRFLDLTEFFMDGLSVEECKSQFQTCVSESCLLAKFLGLVIFLPYKTITPLAPDTLQAQIMVREQVVPPLTLLPQLQRAMATNRLVVTVPWLVAFLGMMDLVAPYLREYRSLLQLLVSIYKALPLPQMSSLSNHLLRCSLGWLFDASFFPQHIFFSLLSSSIELNISSKGMADADVRDVVDHKLLSEVCPYVGLLRRLLVPSSGMRQGVVRHITPVSMQLAPTSQTTLAQTMELHLEECFLNGHSISFRSTVETTIDRVSSTCIKNICSNVIAPAKERAAEEVKQNKEALKITDKQKVQMWIVEQCQKTEREVEASIAEHCGTWVEEALRRLLGSDLADPTVCRTTLAICARRCRERIINWLNSHIKLTDMFSKLIPDADNKPTTELMKPSKARQTVEHKDSAMPPADMIIKLQDKLCECIESRSSVMSEEQVMDIISRTLETVKHRSDLIPIAEHTIFTLTVDLCVVLLAYAPSTVSPTVISQLCALWSVCSAPVSSQLERVMSARNTLLLCQGGPAQAQLSWQRLSFLLVELLKHCPPLLTPSQLETQCVALFRLDWPPMVLSLMGTCLSSMLEKIKHDPICKKNPKFVLLLEWVNEMTEDLSRDDSFEDLA